MKNYINIDNFKFDEDAAAQPVNSVPGQQQQPVNNKVSKFTEENDPFGAREYNSARGIEIFDAGIKAADATNSKLWSPEGTAKVRDFAASAATGAATLPLTLLEGSSRVINPGIADVFHKAKQGVREYVEDNPGWGGNKSELSQEAKNIASGLGEGAVLGGITNRVPTAVRYLGYMALGAGYAPEGSSRADALKTGAVAAAMGGIVEGGIWAGGKGVNLALSGVGQLRNYFSAIGQAAKQDENATLELVSTALRSQSADNPNSALNEALKREVAKSFKVLGVPDVLKNKPEPTAAFLGKAMKQVVDDNDSLWKAAHSTKLSRSVVNQLDESISPYKEDIMKAAAKSGNLDYKDLIDGKLSKDSAKYWYVAQDIIKDMGKGAQPNIAKSQNILGKLKEEVPIYKEAFKSLDDKNFLQKNLAKGVFKAARSDPDFGTVTKNILDTSSEVNKKAFQDQFSKGLWQSYKSTGGTDPFTRIEKTLGNPQQQDNIIKYLDNMGFTEEGRKFKAMVGFTRTVKEALNTDSMGAKYLRRSKEGLTNEVMEKALNKLGDAKWGEELTRIISDNRDRFIKTEKMINAIVRMGGGSVIGGIASAMGNEASANKGKVAGAIQQTDNTDEEYNGEGNY